MEGSLFLNLTQAGPADFYPVQVIAMFSDWLVAYIPAIRQIMAQLLAGLQRRFEGLAKDLSQAAGTHRLFCTIGGCDVEEDSEPQPCD